MKKVIILCVILSVAMIVVACDFTSTPDTMIKAPKSSEAHMEIKHEISSMLDQEERLMVPETMERPAAYFHYDLDGDGAEELVAFYQNKVNQFELGLMVMKKDNSGWKKQQNVAEYGLDIDYFHLADLNQDGSQELIVGIQTGVKNTVYVYQLIEQKYEAIWSHDYDYIDCGDMDQDGIEEIIIMDAEIETTSDISSIKVMEMQEEKMVEVYSDTVPGYGQSIEVGWVSEGVAGAYMILYQDFTDVKVRLLTYEDEQYRWRMDQPIGRIPPENYQNKLFDDIDEDGIIELCHLKYPENYRLGEAHVSGMVEIWTEWDAQSEKIEIVDTIIHNPRQGYKVKVPFQWPGNVVYEVDDSNGIEFINFYEGEAIQERYIGSLVSIDRNHGETMNYRLPQEINQMDLGVNWKVNKAYLCLWVEGGMLSKDDIVKLKKNMELIP